MCFIRFLYSYYDCTIMMNLCCTKQKVPRMASLEVLLNSQDGVIYGQKFILPYR